MPIDRARRLIGVSDNEAGVVELWLVSGADVHDAVRHIRETLGTGYSVKDKYMQNETVYRMMRIEKTVIFMILLFIIIVVSCNVFGSLTMLIIEKRDDIATLQYLGARPGLIRRIFFDEGWMIVLLGAVVGLLVGIGLCLIQQYVGVIRMDEGWMIVLLGAAVGLLVGIGLCLIQQYVGVIRMPGNFVVDYYPVVIKPLDIIITLAGIALIGLFITALPTRRTLSRIL